MNSGLLIFVSLYGQNELPAGDLQFPKRVVGIDPPGIFPASTPSFVWRSAVKYKKISGPLLAAFEDLQEAGPTALALHRRTLGMAPVLGTQKPPQAIVFIHCDEKANLENMSDGGLKLNQRRGRVRTALLPLDMLD